MKALIDMTRDELRIEAKELDIKGRGRMTAPELRTAVAEMRIRLQAEATHLPTLPTPNQVRNLSASEAIKLAQDMNTPGNELPSVLDTETQGQEIVHVTGPIKTTYAVDPGTHTGTVQAVDLTAKQGKLLSEAMRVERSAYEAQRHADLVVRSEAQPMPTNVRVDIYQYQNRSMKLTPAQLRRIKKKDTKLGNRIVHRPGMELTEAGKYELGVSIIGTDHKGTPIYLSYLGGPA